MTQDSGRKRILHISKYYYPFQGGTEQIARECVLALKDTCEQKVLSFNHEFGETKDFVDDVEIIRCKCFAKVFSQSLSLSYKAILRATIREFKPDVVIFHYPNPFVASFLLHMLPKETELVVYWHLDIVKQKVLRVLFEKQNQQLVSRADKIIATSPNYVEGSRFLRAARDKCVVIPNCITESRLLVTEENQRFAEVIKEKYKGKTICLAVGRHTAYKGFEYLIRAAHELEDDFIILLIGKGELTASLRKEAGDDKKIVFLGSVSDEELRAYFLAMDIFCFPSITKNEAFGVALAEAMYYEKPAVTFTIPGSGVNYVCLADECGLEVANGDVKAYAEALYKLADNRELRDSLGRRGRKRVEELFSSKSFRENIRKMLEE